MPVPARHRQTASVIQPHERLPLPHPGRVMGLTRAPASPGSPAVHELAGAQPGQPARDRRRQAHAPHTAGMSVRLHHIVVDAYDLPGLARFWTQAPSRKVLSERENEIVIGTDENAPAGMCFSRQRSQDGQQPGASVFAPPAGRGGTASGSPFSPQMISAGARIAGKSA